MPAKSYTLDFKGFRAEGTLKSLENDAGIYIVFGAVEQEDNTVSVKRLIYIGQAADFKERLNPVSGHHCYKEWKAALKAGELLYFSRAQLEESELNRVENALIYHLQPPANEKCKTSFPYDATTITVKGRVAKIEPTTFTVQRKD